MGVRRLVGTACLLFVATVLPATQGDFSSGYTVAAADVKREEARARRIRPKRPMRTRFAVAGAKRNVVHHRGHASWSLDGVASLDESFRAVAGRALPISAYGQTDLHTHLGYDHSGAVDVALHPDSRDGQALQRLLRDAGIPFMVARRSVLGIATGAHIHVGSPSRRLTAIASQPSEQTQP